MKIGYRTVAFVDRPVEQALQTIAESGFNAVELCLENPALDPRAMPPTRVAEIVGFGMPRPRGVESLSHESFVRTKAHTLEVFQREVRKGEGEA